MLSRGATKSPCARRIWNSSSTTRINPSLDAGLQRVGRADSYYDDNLGPAKVLEGRTPDAVDVEQGLKGEDENARPKNRDELIGTIQGFASDMAQAIDDAFTQANTIIQEPD